MPCLLAASIIRIHNVLNIAFSLIFKSKQKCFVFSNVK